MKTKILHASAKKLSELPIDMPLQYVVKGPVHIASATEANFLARRAICKASARKKVMRHHLVRTSLGLSPKRWRNDSEARDIGEAGLGGDFRDHRVRKAPDQARLHGSTAVH